MILIPHNKLVEIKCRTTWMDSEYRGSLVIQQPYDTVKHLLSDDLPISAMLCNNDDRSIIYPRISIYEISRHFSDYNDCSIKMTFMVIPW